MNAEYYPTPRPVIAKMLNGIDARSLKAKQILEPQAGEGALLDYLTGICGVSSRNVYAIEEDADLAYTLQGKDYKVIHNDFLTYSGDYLFDLILMNPPFSNGDEHLLKAWEVMQEGDIVCLLNAETIRNPYTSRRKYLAKVIDDFGSVEYLGDCFSQATRRTDVDVALVRLHKAEKDPRFDFSFSGNAERKFDFSEELISDQLAMNDLTGALLRQYEMTKSAYVGYIKARKELEFYSQGLIYSHNSVTKLADENYSPNLSASYNGFLNSFKSEAWSMILGKLNVGKFLTNSVMKDFEKYKKSQGAMDLTRENILSMVQILIMNRGSIMEKAVVDVFDIFTKYHKENRCHVEGWKTNDYWKVNKKIILPYYLDDIRWSTYYSTSHRCYQEFADIEKVMCYLTGRDYAQTPSIKDFISKVRIGDSGEHESTFFYFRCYKKGTLHLRFKDEKLWEEFNRQACKGKMWLPD
ncbi:uncharacterized protein DUF4942 [Spirosoma oryzae]|uniref:Uncharacterized protein DUF4942 n=1 Tax=Spirosoma oryzae TaxID=1469603 RepID=A0A2T0SNT0_9BACT|nr:DUF4942 domain-containing protein [Spirosoma oryzae]PRY35067.1 uncharacterized protein DUF4942 [Spirosoma oryzae]